MKTPSSDQIAHAASLIHATHADQRAIRNLDGLIAASNAMHAAQDSARYDRLNFMRDPDKLVGLIELARRTDAETRRRIRPAYDWLLTVMHDGVGPGARPHKVNFDTLTAGARPYLLAPYLNLSVAGVYPRLCLERSDVSRGRLVYVISSGAVVLDDWRPHLEHMSAWLGDHWTISGHTATTITLTRQTPLPQEIAFDPTWLRPGWMFLGLDVTTRRPHHVALADFAHTLVTGTTGMGKSVALDAMLRSLLANISMIDHIYAADPAGIAFSRYRGLHPKLTTLGKPHDLWAVTAQLVRTMEQREAELEATGRSRFTDRFIVLIVDEFPAFNTPDTVDKKSDEFKAHQAFVGHVMALGRRARKAGIKLIFIVQEPTERDISSGVRSVLPGVLAFRTPLVAHATSLFGELGQLPADPRTLARGRALYRDGTSGDVAHVQFPIAPPPPRKTSP